jgi:cellulose synthase/poly-beta-1,6-N-acetylglucosamine synthase-like glycosyltransferase
MDNSLPTVSLLISMRNESKHIADCLRSIFDQDYPAEKVTVFVMDGNSVDGSWDIVSSLFSQRQGCTLLENSGIYQSHGWNIGIAQSCGEIIGIVSAHSRLAPDYISVAVQTLLRTGADMVGGPMTAAGAGYVANAIALATSSPFGVGSARFHYSDREEEMDTVYMGLCGRAVYERIGGFDEEMIRNQDDELSYRLRKVGGRIVCNPRIRSYYHNRSTLQSLSKQYFQYGLYKIRVLQKHPRQMSLRQFVPPLFVLALLLSVLILVFPLIRGLGVLVPVLYFFVNAIASTWSASKHCWKYLPLLPLVFAILHISYGLGFLLGLFKFRHRWSDKTGQVPVWKQV